MPVYVINMCRGEQRMKLLMCDVGWSSVGMNAVHAFNMRWREHRMALILSDIG